MPQFNPRTSLFQNVVALPASKSAGAATFSSAIFKMTQNTGYSGAAAANTVYVPGNSYKTEIVIHANDYTKVTNNGAGSCVPVNLMGSWDGNNYFLLQSNGGAGSGMSNSSTSGVTFKFELCPAFANFYRIDVVFDATGALVATHGVAIDFIVMDDSVQANRVAFYGAGVHSAATTTFTALASTTYPGVTLAIPGNNTQAAITAGNITTPIAMNNDVQKLYIFAALQGASTPLTGANCTLTLQGSLDGANWYTVCTLTNAALAATAGTIVLNEVVCNDNVRVATGMNFAYGYAGGFFRLNVVDSTATWTNTSTAFLYPAIVALY